MAMLLELTILTIILSLVYHFYTKWPFYKVSWKVPGPWSLPFVGSVNYLISARKGAFEAFGSSMSYYSTDRISLWIGSRYLFVTQDPKDIEIILTHPDCIDKFDMVYDKLEPIVGNGLIRSKTELWRRHRKLLSPSFSKSVLETFTDDLYKNSCRLVDQLHNEFGDKDRDISYFMYNYVVLTYCANFMGVDVDELNRKLHWGTIVQRGNKWAWRRMFIPWYNNEWLFSFFQESKEYYKSVQEIRQFCLKVLEMSMGKFENSPLCPNDQNKRKILVELMLDLLKQQQLTIEEVQDEIITILIGATDTTALTLSFTAVILGMYPEVQKTALEEVLEVCGRDSSITLNHLTELKYLERVFNEVMRLFPLVPQVARQTRNYVQLGDLVLPPGTGLGALVFKVHRDKRFWPDPLKFNPDRFLPEECAKRNPYTFLPFLSGPRNCIGLKYGMLLLKMAMANLLRNFEFQSKYKNIEDIEVMTVVFSKMRHGFQCKVRNRS